MSFFFILGWARMGTEFRYLTTAEKQLKPMYSGVIQFSGKIISVRKTKSKKYRYHLESLQIKNLKPGLEPSFGLFLYSRDSIACSVGNVLRISNGLLSAIGGPRNPGEFDFHRFYLFRRILGRVSILDSTRIEVIPERPNRLDRWLEQTRDWVRDRFTRNLDHRSGSLITALILGDKEDLDPGLVQEFQRIGVIHVLAVSGLHVGYILLILIIVVRTLGIPWGWDRIAILVGLLAYTAITGYRPSVIRAASMSGLYLLAPLLNRRPDSLNIIGTVAWVMLFIKPVSMFSGGFQLSFLAVISIIGFLEYIEPGFPGPLRMNYFSNFIVRGVYGLILVSLAAQVGTLPVTFSMFHRIPVIGLIANCLIVPLIGVLVSLGFLLLVAAGIPIIGFSVSQGIGLLSAGIAKVASVLAEIPWASISPPGSPLILVALVYAVWTGGLYFLNPTRFKPGLFVSLILFSGVIWSWATKPLDLNILFLDVGQGDSMIIQLPDQRTMLIDGGPRNYRRDSGRDVVLPVLSYLGITRLNWMVATHPHSDHLGGLISVLQTIPVDTVVTIRRRSGSHLETRFFTLLDSAGTIVDSNSIGKSIVGGRGVGVQFLWPPKDWGKRGNINNQSIVVRISEGKKACLLMGDLEMDGERELLIRWKLPPTTLVKLGHHGSITGTSPEFLDAIDPQIAVISVGARNKFGHPSPVVLRRLTNRRIQVHRTDDSGALWVRIHNDQLDSLSWK